MATQLAFTTQPATSLFGAGSGVNFSTQPVVSVEDANQNVVITATNQITLAIGSSPAGRTGTLHCTTNPLAAAAGAAAFAGCNITHTQSAKNGWTLTASATGLTGDTSNAFTT
jgi:ABC-type branched-subunit amino acid transport system ATPase component